MSDYPVVAGPDRTNLIRYPSPNRLGLATPRPTTKEV
jgi:hypothetical protein